MSSIDNKGENEFNYDESNMVGKSENSEEEEDDEISDRIKKEIIKDKDAITQQKKKDSKYFYHDISILITQITVDVNSKGKIEIWFNYQYAIFYVIYILLC